MGSPVRKFSVIDFPNPSYPSPLFKVRRVEVYLHVHGFVERRRVEPLRYN
jgi:hypothetical protein